VKSAIAYKCNELLLISYYLINCHIIKLIIYMVLQLFILNPFPSCKFTCSLFIECFTICVASIAYRLFQKEKQENKAKLFFCFKKFNNLIIFYIYI